MALDVSSGTILRPARFHLGSWPILGDRILAPMDGVSDWPFRSICRAFGSAFSYTAFVGAQEALQGQARALRTLYFTNDERPVVFQLFDDEEDRLAEAALRLQDLAPDGIDVNMGCSARCVSGRGAGAGLLRDPVKIGRILARLSASLEVPVSAKIRLGWDDTSRNYLLVAQAVEENGAALLAVHGRTRAQGYAGEADWQAIAEIKAHVRIPVLGNGDIRTLADAERRLAESGCDAVLIGRAAMGNPWIFQGRSKTDVPRAEWARVIETHLQRMLAYHGEAQGVVAFRKHLTRYLDGLDLPPDHRLTLLTLTEAAAVRRELDHLGLGPDSAAEITDSSTVAAEAAPPV
jgi:nifR3 family TIM-barrel protein